MTSAFFESNNYFIDEKVNFLKFANEYKVYNESAQQIGVIKQKLSTGQKVLHLILNKAMLPFHLDFVNNNNEVEASISRGWTFFMSRIEVLDYDGKVIATIKQRFKFLKPTFEIFDLNMRQIAEIKGDWKAWNFTILNQDKTEIGAISKKWAGVTKELFTTADKYNVVLQDKTLDKNSKKSILACAISVDMILKESK